MVDLHCFCFVRSIRHIATIIRGNSKKFKCHCFKFLVCRLLLSVLLSRGHKKLLSIVTHRNYMFVTNKYIYDSLEKSNGHC